jgi:hypothetical protein
MCEGAFGSVAAILRIPGARSSAGALVPHVVGRVAEAVPIQQILAALQQVVEFGDDVHIALLQLFRQRQGFEHQERFHRLICAVGEDGSRHQRSRPRWPKISRRTNIMHSMARASDGCTENSQRIKSSSASKG